MTPADAKQLEALLADFANADYEARRANAARARAHIAIVEFVASRVPAGTSDDGALDIPAFLRKT